MNDIRLNTDGLALLWANVVSFVPKLLAFVVILVVGYFVARLLAKLFDRLLERLKFDNLVERGGVKRVLDKSGTDASDVLAKLLFYTIILFTLQFAFGVFGPNPISDVLTRIIAYIPNLFVAAIIVIIGAAVAKAVKDIMGISLGGFAYGKILSRGAAIAIMVVAVFAALNQLGIAPAIVTGLFYAILAVVVGSAIVAIGGGGIVPMRSRWERALGRVEAEAPKLAGQGARTAEVAEQKGREWAAKAEQWTGSPAGERGQPEFRPHDEHH